MNTMKDPSADAVDAVWRKLRDNERLFQEIRGRVMRRIDEKCKQQINAGNYDSSANLSTIYEWFSQEYLDSSGKLTEEVFKTSAVQRYHQQYGTEVLGRIIFDRLIDALESDGELLYVYDRQRVRSQVAEMARYFALIRQRIDKDTEFTHEPNLVKMVKMAIVDREQPKLDGDAAVSFGATLREIHKELATDVDPTYELQQTCGSEWKEVVKETTRTFKTFFDEGLPSEFSSLAAYQKQALVDIYLESVTDQTHTHEHANVITASTGGGKTEAFLFPVLMYCHTAWKAGVTGNKGILTYPRRDLCNNQFERLFDYVHTFNTQLDSETASLEDAPISIAIQHGGRKDVTVDCPDCDGTLEPPDDGDGQLSCSRNQAHTYSWATTERTASADIIITTQNSLHLRLMDRHGREAFWEQTHPPKFLVLDEVHVYTEQAGMHVANVARRFKQAVRHRSPGQQPTLVSSSATINEAEEFTRRIFGTDEATEITPAPDEKDKVGSEYILFVKATEPRDVTVPIGDAVFRPQEEWGEDIERTTASNLSCMIQIAFAFWHTTKKERGGTDKPDKDKILGFVDSIDSVSRLGNYVEDAEQNRELFSLRRPDAFLRGDGDNPDCPSEKFRSETDDQYDESAVCESLPPNKHLNECPVYEAGECWWTMKQNFELRPMNMAVQKSGRRQSPSGGSDPGDAWDQLIATSTLEVGFDHESIIGTFQYRAPMSVPSFLQRKGRGGRDADDRPVTVVVLGSNSTDSYYFHHSDYLSDPREEHLQIPLDEENRYVRAEHMIAAIVDYFNVRDGIDSEQIYRSHGNMYGPNIEQLQTLLQERRDELADWLDNTFDPTAEEREQALDTLSSYLDSLDEPVAPGINETPYWEFFGEMVAESGASGSNRTVDDLIQQLRGDRRE